MDRRRPAGARHRRSRTQAIAHALGAVEPRALRGPASLRGVYVDTDVERLRPLRPLLRGIDSFAALEVPGRIGNAILGSVVGHSVFARAARLARQTIGTGPHSREANGPHFLSLIVEQEPNVAIFAATLFYPYLWDELERRHETFPDAYAVHHWTLSWLDSQAPR